MKRHFGGRIVHRHAYDDEYVRASLFDARKFVGVEDIDDVIVVYAAARFEK